jgi:hypothetical protein
MAAAFFKRLCPLKTSNKKSILITPDSIDIIIPNISNEECIICLDYLSEAESSTLLKCGHTFHSGCIYAWFIYNKNNRCPICNTYIEI